MSLAEIRARIEAAPTSSAGDPDWLADAKVLLAALDAQCGPNASREALGWPTGKFSLHDPEPENIHSRLYLVFPNGLMVAFDSDPTEGLDQARGEWLVKTLNAALDARGERLTAHYNAPSERGGYVGDVFFGDEHDTTRGTHRWDGENWLPLPAPPTEAQSARRVGRCPETDGLCSNPNCNSGCLASPAAPPPTSDREKRLVEALTEIENAPNEMEDPDAKYMQLIAHDALETYRND